MPCDYSQYPKDWKERRIRILTRAKHRCEHCGLPNRAVGYRDEEGRFRPCAGNLAADAAGQGRHYQGFHQPRLTAPQAGEWVRELNNCTAGRLRCDDEGRHWFYVVLTVAHLDHDASNESVSDERLAALCQQCHNRLDAKERARRRAGLGNLFAAPTPRTEGASRE